MKKGRNELVEFLVGLALCASGLFVLSQKVIVTSSFGSYMYRGYHINGGLTVVPFIVGIVILFVSDSIWGKIVTFLGILIIVASIIMSTSFRLMHLNLFDYLIILVGVFGGGALLAKVLLNDSGGGRGSEGKRGSKGKRKSE